MEDNFFSKLPNWLRWVIFIPLSALSFFIIPILVSLINSFYFINTQSFIGQLLINAAGIIGFVFVTYYCVPKKKGLIAGIECILFCILSGLALFSVITYGSENQLRDLVIDILILIMCIYFTVIFLSGKMDEEISAGS